MSGGVAYVFDEDGAASSARCNTEMVELETVGGDDAEHAPRAASKSTSQRTGSRKARELLDSLGGGRRASSSRWCRPSTGACSRRRQIAGDQRRSCFRTSPPPRRMSRRARYVPRTARSRRPMGKIRGFLEIERHEARQAAGRRAARRLARVRARRSPEAELARAGVRAAWTAASRSVTTAVRSGTSSPTGTTTSTTGASTTALARCTRPTTSPRSPGASARRRARRRACSTSTKQPVTIKNVERGIIDRAFEHGLRRRRVLAGVKTGKRSRWSARVRRLAAAQQLARAGHDVTRVRARRSHRRPASLRHPRLQDGEAHHRSARRCRCEPRASTFRTGVHVRRRRHRRRAARRATTRSCSAAARASRAICRCPGASSTASTSRWSFSSREPARRRRRRARRRGASSPPASASSSSAAATPARTASAPRTARAPRT